MSDCKFLDGMTLGLQQRAVVMKASDGYSDGDETLADSEIESDNENDCVRGG